MPNGDEHAPAAQEAAEADDDNEVCESILVYSTKILLLIQFT